VAEVDWPNTNRRISVMAILETKSISPDYASFLLEGNTRNRKISRTHVKALASAMTDGRFKYNGDTLKVDRNGNLVDGQHRLEAIIESGTTQMMSVVSGLDPEVFHTIDQGKKRNTGDLLSVINSSRGNCNVMAAAAKWLVIFEKRLLPSKHKFLVDGRHDLFIECFEKNEVLLYEGARYGHKKTLKRVVSESTSAAVFCHYAKEDYSRTVEFFEDITSMQPKIMLAIMLRARLDDNKMAKSKMKRDEIPCLFMKALRKFLDGQEVKQLKFAANEDVCYAKYPR
jgi:hypothetical protein